MHQATIADNHIYCRNPSIVTRHIAGETLLVPITGKLADMQRIFPLDRVAAFIWEQLDGRRDLSEICKRILGQFEVEPETARKDLFRFVSELREAGLIEGNNPEDAVDGA